MSAAVILVLAVTFAAAAVAKLRDREPFVATLKALVPTRAAAPLARALPAGELVLAGALVAGVVPRLTALLVLGALAVFSLALLRLRAAGGTGASAGPARSVIPCNCFGAAGDGDPATALVRNGLLATLAVVAVVWPVGGPLWALPAGELAGAATVALGALCAWQLGVVIWRPPTPAAPVLPARKAAS